MDDELRNEIREKMRFLCDSPSKGDCQFDGKDVCHCEACKRARGVDTERMDEHERESWEKFHIDTDDPINRPAHYTQGQVECIDAIMSASAGWPSWAAPLLGPVIKYVWRAFLKGKAGRDLAKADWYLTKARDELLRRGYTEE